MKMHEILKVDENAAAAAAVPAAKGFSRFLPGIGLAASGYDAYNRAKRGDYTGAALSGVGGLASFIPGIGTAASLGLAAANAMRDKQRTGSYFPTDSDLDAANLNNKTPMQPIDQQPTQAPTVQAGGASATAGAQPTAQAGTTTTTTPKGDPKVYSLQQQLIAKGAKITADGIMGPQTQAAMKQFGIAEEIKENKMSNSEKMAQLRDRLKLLESKQTNTEGLADVARGAWNVGKNFVGGLGGKMVQGTAKTAQQLATSQAATNAARIAAGKTPFSPAQLAAQAKNLGAYNAASKAAKIANRAGQAIARNPGKTALAGTALGAAGGYALGKSGQPEPTPAPAPAPKPPNGGGGTKPAPKPPNGGGAAKPAVQPLNAQEEQELALLAKEFEPYMGKLPQLDALLLKHQKLRGDIPQP